MTQWLKKIIKEEKKLERPSEPQPVIQQINLPILGQLVKRVYNKDKEQYNNSIELKKRAKQKISKNNESEASSMASLFQDSIVPNVMELLGTRIEMVFEFNLETNNNKNEIKTDTRWCGGIIRDVCKGLPTHRWNISGFVQKYFKAGEAAKVEWDSMPEVESNIAKETTIEVLDPKKWNKNVIGGWQHDVGNILSNINN